MAPPLLRFRADDALTAAFPQAQACPETLPQGPLPVPMEHPLVAQTVHDCLREAMDEPSFLRLLQRIHRLTIGRLRREIEPLSAQDFMRFANDEVAMKEFMDTLEELTPLQREAVEDGTPWPAIARHILGLRHGERGAQRGRDLGFPTANVFPTPLAAVPAEAVYAGRLVVSPYGDVEQSFPAAISVGSNPTFQGDQLTVEAPAAEPRFYTVVKGDTLSKIAASQYGSASKYPVIFEANKPMLKDPDKIYPGQNLRIPPL